jgi:hypothetical protein
MFSFDLLLSWARFRVRSQERSHFIISWISFLLLSRFVSLVFQRLAQSHFFLSTSLFFFNFLSSFNRFISFFLLNSSSSSFSFLILSHSFTSRSFAFLLFAFRSFTSRSFTSRSFASRSFASSTEVETIIIFRRINRNFFVIEKNKRMFALMKKLKLSFENFVINAIEMSENSHERKNNQRKRRLMNKKMSSFVFDKQFSVARIFWVLSFKLSKWITSC